MKRYIKKNYVQNNKFFYYLFDSRNNNKKRFRHMLINDKRFRWKFIIMFLLTKLNLESDKKGINNLFKGNYKDLRQVLKQWFDKLLLERKLLNYKNLENRLDNLVLKVKKELKKIKKKMKNYLNKI